MTAAVAHHPIIQEVDELLSKGAFEPSSGSADFYSSVLLSLSVLVASSLYLTLSGLIIICIYLLLRCLLLDMSGSLFSMVIMLSPLITRIYLHIPIVNYHHLFYDLFGTIHHINGRFYLLGWLQPLGFSQASLNLSCSFVTTMVSILLSVKMTSWSWSL